MPQYVIDYFWNLWSVSLEAAPWLLLGLIVSGLIKVWLPTRLMQRFLGGKGWLPIVNAAVLGTPLPLCSCSVIPAAITIRRSGASKPATVSFLVATPENGADSLALSYALLGPFMTIVRPVAAIFSALAAGFLTLWFTRNEADEATAVQMSKAGAQAVAPSKDHALAVSSCCETSTDKPLPVSSCCDSKAVVPVVSSCCSTDNIAAEKPAPASSCCETTTTSCCSSIAASDVAGSPSLAARLAAAVHFAVDDLLGDIVLWLGIGLLLAALVSTFISPGAMAQWGSGIGPMLIMLIVGVPMYTCATASTPLAAAMLMAGVSPGTTLVFLLAGPATNIGTIGIVRRELGTRTCAAYLIGVCGGALLTGLATDWLVAAMKISISGQVHDHGHFVPHWLAVASLILLIAMTIKLFAGRLLKKQTKDCHSPATA